MAWRSASVLGASALAMLGLAMAAGAPAARAGDLEFFTGEALYAECSAQASMSDYLPRQARCAGYVLGVSDSQQAAQGAGAAGRVCLPNSVSSTQLVLSVERYLGDHPDKRRFAARDLVIEALAAAFPCQ